MPSTELTNFQNLPHIATAGAILNQLQAININIMNMNNALNNNIAEVNVNLNDLERRWTWNI